MRSIWRRFGDIRSGALRFWAASFWSAALFLLSAWRELFEGPALLPVFQYGSESAAFLSLLWETFLEGRRFPHAACLRWLSFPAGGLLIWYFNGLDSPEWIYAAAGICGAALFLSLYVWMRRYGEAAAAVLFTGALKSLGLTLLLGLSLMVCLWAVDALLIDIRPAWYTVAWEGAVFVAGFNLFLSWVPKKPLAAVPAALSSVLVRLLFPVYGLLLLILYGYIGKIFVTASLPVGEMNWFASLAVLGYVFFLALLPGSGDPLMRWWLRWGGLVLAPVVALQLYCVEIRFSAYGLTELRYASLLCTGFGILVMTGGLLRRAVSLFCPIAAALLLMGTVSPLNIRDVPIRDQQYRAQQVLMDHGMMQNGEIVRGQPLDKEAADQLFSAWRYLRLEERSDGPYTFSTQIARSPVIAAMAEEQEAQSGRYAYLESGPLVHADVAGYTRLYSFKESAENGQLRVRAGDQVVFEGSAEAFLEALFSTRTPEETPLPAFWQADETHLVIFQSVERIREEGKALRYDTEGLLLVK